MKLPEDGTTRERLDAALIDMAEQEQERAHLQRRSDVLHADELLEMARATRDAAQLKIRETFHKRWGSYWKCGRCGGPLGLGPVSGVVIVAKPCPHGDHEIVLTHNGYSWMTREHGHCEAGAGGCEVCDRAARTHWTASS